MSDLDLLEQLPQLALDELRALWRTRYGAPPTLRSAEALRWSLAWRLQAARFGDLDAATRKAIRSRRRPGAVLAAGGRAAREWNGVVHEVEAAADGFVYAGERFGSLSEVARRITGVRWNGPRFFGLRTTP